MLPMASASACASGSTWSRYCRDRRERRLREVEHRGRARLAAEVGEHRLADVLVHEEVGDVVGEVGGLAGEPLEDRPLAHGRRRRDRDPARSRRRAAVRRRFDDRSERRLWTM